MTHLRKGETYRDLAVGSGIGTTTAYRYLREARGAGRPGPDLEQAMRTARPARAYVTLDGTLLRIDRVAMASQRDRPYYSGKHKAHGVNVQVIADPAGRLIWASPTVPGARHDARAARARHPRRARRAAGVTAFADTANTGLGLDIRAPYRRTCYDRKTRKFVSRKLSRG